MAAPLATLLGAFDRPQWQWLLIPTVCTGAVLLWAAIGLGSYSGRGVPPMYGDFEAQRHWLEITTHLPTDQWYWYDLQYWGLDYPPLTAYHSWVLGRLGALREPAWFALDASRGTEDAGLVAYMRQTVLGSELAFYVPAVAAFVADAARVHQTPIGERAAVLGAILLQPSLALIDNGHFQYNAVMLGLFVASVVALQRGHVFWASVAFMSSVLFKQMALYYSPVIFAWILGQAVFPRVRVRPVLVAGVAVLGTTALALAPWLTSPAQLAQVALRVFPFARGLWEDKVANLWCTANTVVKLKARFTQAELQRLALAATLAGILPACTAAFVNLRRPGAAASPRVLPWAFAASAWAFFLFSFQVHEKSVLLPLMPTTLLLTLRNQPEVEAMVLWVNNVAYFSMWPLLQRDGLAFQYFVVGALWNYLTAAPLRLPRHPLNALAVVGSYAAIAALSVATAAEAVPLLDKYPDLLVLANVTLSFGSFVYFWLWLQLRMLTLPSEPETADAAAAKRSTEPGKAASKSSTRD